MALVIVTEIRSRGIERAEQVTYSNGARKAVYRDVDGNEIGLGAAPLEPGATQQV